MFLCEPFVQVEDFRNMGDILGQSRNLGQGSGSRNTGTIYGKPSMNPKKTHWSAGEIIKGFYQPEDQLPDRDLEKSIMPGFRNVTVEVSTSYSPFSRIMFYLLFIHRFVLYAVLISLDHLVVPVFGPIYPARPLDEDLWPILRIMVMMQRPGS